jgi:hypothetical protein
MPPKPKRPLPPPPAEPPIERPLPPRRNTRPALGTVAAVAVALLAALGVGWWLGHRTGAPSQPPQQEKPALVTMPITAPVSPTVPPMASLPRVHEPAITTVSATKPAKVLAAKAEPPRPKPVVVQYTVGPAKPLTPQLPPRGDGHVLNAGQVLYCLATGKLLDEITPRAYTAAAHREVEYQTEDYNRRCGAYSYSAVSMERAMQRFEQLRPQIHARARQLMRKWGTDEPPPMRFHYIEYDDSDW